MTTTESAATVSVGEEEKQESDGEHSTYDSLGQGSISRYCTRRSRRCARSARPKANQVRFSHTSDAHAKTQASG